MITWLTLAVLGLIAVLVGVCALWRIDARDADRWAHIAHRQADRLRVRQIQIRHKQERIEALRDELDVQYRTRPSATAAMLADLDALPMTHEREYPR
ncbi:hypothetical protein [Micromonospora sp. HUAS LYJ1]|uniref:hypothetical protein n=1 Tax=Micromonospora sp. HUAS LYJ1 TaxID=3061626 RepID=UPI002670D9EC|nr:hypothetical protein [Micromonospora sp. HUAS LYJ1]WKU03722.1 hypothetical protein Q2K16_23200 [Micromonospora sp. HUAS LYJ1]